MVAANFAVDGRGNMVRDGDTGAVQIGGMKLMPLNSQINLRSHYEQQVFKEFNPPTMDEDTYMELLRQQGFFAQNQPAGAPASGAAAAAADADSDAAVDAATLKARDWDNWKDDHPFGAGNKGRR